MSSLNERLQAELQSFKDEGVYKVLNHIKSPQDPVVTMEEKGEVIVLSSNNYMGLSNHPEVVRAGKEALDAYGAGTASVRFICGTFTIHRELEDRLADLSGTEAALTYVSCWNANTGLFATITDSQDVIISDELNHASIIDGVRWSKAAREIYAHSDMKMLEEKLKAHSDKRTRLIVTDGVFSMEGDVAKLADILELAKKYDAVVCVDDSHGTGVLGKTGRGTPEHCGLQGEVDIITSTLGKALGGAAGGYVAGSQALIDYLIQRSRPQLFSNALPCTVAASAKAAVDVLLAHPEQVARLHENASYFRSVLKKAGFNPLEGETPIVPVIVGETSRAISMSNQLLEEGVFVTGFGFPVVPKGTARLRCQISAAHTREQLDRVIEAFKKVGSQAGLVS